MTVSYKIKDSSAGILFDRLKAYISGNHSLVWQGDAFNWDFFRKSARLPGTEFQVWPATRFLSGIVGWVFPPWVMKETLLEGSLGQLCVDFLHDRYILAPRVEKSRDFDLSQIVDSHLPLWHLSQPAGRAVCIENAPFFPSWERMALIFRYAFSGRKARNY